MRWHVTLGLAAAFAAASPVRAQMTPHQFRVTPRFGYIKFDRGTSIDNDAYIGLQTDYAFTKHLALGLGFGATQPKTIADDFVHSLQFGDTTRLFSVRQSLSVVDYGAHAIVALPLLARMSPYLLGGAGMYTVYLDPQVAGAPKSVSHMMYSLGGGASFRVADRTAILLDLRDLVYTGYKRDKLFQSTASDFPFIEDVPKPHATSTTAHNIVISLGFSFTPRLRGTPEGDTEGGDDK